MPAHLTSEAALNRHFLETRCKIIEIAANLDRIDRGAGASAAMNDPRLPRIRAAIQALLESGPGRAEKCQTIFSLPYDGNWQQATSR